jgi:hypothetical protein
MPMTEDNDHSNGHSPRGGRWVSDGGRLEWIPARDQRPQALGDDEEEDAAALADLDALDEATWASDAPPLPQGAPESARVRAALAWLRRMRDTEREIVGELALIERDQLRQQDAMQQEMGGSRRTRGPQPPNPITVQMAEHGAAADWYETAIGELEEEADRSPGRALVEWYLWMTTLAAPAPASSDLLATARLQGQADARRRTQRHAEHLALPEMDDEE